VRVLGYAMENFYANFTSKSVYFFLASLAKKMLLSSAKYFDFISRTHFVHYEK